MDDGGGRRVRQVGGEPVVDRLEVGQRARRVGLVEAAEALQLPGQIALRTAEAGQLRDARVDRVELDQAVHQGLRDRHRLTPRAAPASR